MSRRNLKQEHLRKKFHLALVARSVKRPNGVTHGKAKRVYRRSRCRLSTQNVVSK